MKKKNINRVFQRLTKKKKGYFLVDILVSIVILSLGIVSASNVVMHALKAGSVNKDRIIATNLGIEAIEGIRMMRETNWLRYSHNKRVCWNFWENTNENYELNMFDEQCSENGVTGQNYHPIGLAQYLNRSDPTVIDHSAKVKSYLVVLDRINYSWYLVENFEVYDPNTFSFTRRTCDDNTLTMDDDCNTEWADRRGNATTIAEVSLGTKFLSSRLYIDGNTGLYTHHPYYDTGVIGTDRYQENEETDFYREVYISYPDSDSDNDGVYGEDIDGFLPDNKVEDNTMRVKVVTWYRGFSGKPVSVVLETDLTDFLDRINWDD